MRSIYGATLSLLFLLLTSSGTVLAQADSTQSEQTGAPHVFLDCGYNCDLDYIRTEIPFVNYVRHPDQADVHVLVTTQQTGSGGTDYTFAFIGKGQFAGVSNTLSHASRKSDTQEDIRKAMVRIMKAGLVAYVARSTVFSQINIMHDKGTAGEKAAPADAWDYWLFTISTNNYFNGEKTSSFLNGWSSVTASRTTELWKVRLNTDLSYSQERFEFEIDDTTTFVSENYRRSQNANASVIRSLDDHWSVGVFATAYKNTFSNIDLSASVGPAIEYNIFPYAESTRRQLRLGYRIGVATSSYVDTTVFFKKEENLFSHNISAALSLKQTWGSASITAGISQYLHDGSKNNLRFHGNVSIRIVEGLSVNFYGGYEAIHDQLSLRKGGASVTQVLRQQRQLETSFSYWGSLGISYSFGSIYNNIVNPRFGNSGGSTIIISN